MLDDDNDDDEEEEEEEEDADDDDVFVALVSTVNACVVCAPHTGRSSLYGRQLTAAATYHSDHPSRCRLQRSVHYVTVSQFSAVFCSVSGGSSTSLQDGNPQELKQ